MATTRTETLVTRTPQQPGEYATRVFYKCARCRRSDIFNTTAIVEKRHRGYGRYDRDQKFLVRMVTTYANGTVQDETFFAFPPLRSCECGRTMVPNPLRAVKSDAVPCDARCTDATGHNCECSCGGQFHGSEKASN